ncbi:MAG: hypothetical protein R8P61_06705 [Bacteroidia bacterium]|nr:hypothetical protein [Bacteroidia bacterium]
MQQRLKIHKELKKDLIFFILILIALALFGFMLNPVPTHNSNHSFSQQAIKKDSVLNERQYGEIKYDYYLRLLQKSQIKNPSIKIDTSSHWGYLRVYLDEDENSSRSAFNLPCFNKMTADPYPDLGKFKDFLSENLDMQLAYDDDVYGFELKIRRKGNSRSISIPYQMLVGLVNQDKDLK